jgi:hypothetical protein
MDLHPLIRTYFDADRRRDREALTDTFAPDATVVDEGRIHVGREAIGAWWSEKKAQYQSVLEPLDASKVDGATVVNAQVSGDFVGSPAILTFAFGLAHGRIRFLEIGA